MEDGSGPGTPMRWSAHHPSTAAARPSRPPPWCGRPRSALLVGAGRRVRFPLHAQVAQSVEHLTRNEKVKGSIPFLGSNCDAARRRTSGDIDRVGGGALVEPPQYRSRYAGWRASPTRTSRPFSRTTPRARSTRLHPRRPRRSAARSWPSCWTWPTRCDEPTAPVGRGRHRVHAPRASWAAHAPPSGAVAGDARRSRFLRAVRSAWLRRRRRRCRGGGASRLGRSGGRAMLRRSTRARW